METIKSNRFRIGLAIALGMVLGFGAMVIAVGGAVAGVSIARLYDVNDELRAEMADIRQDLWELTLSIDAAVDTIAGLPGEAQSGGYISNDTPAMPAEERGLSRAEIVEIVRAAIAGIPSKAAPADYTQHVVDSAIARYETQGRDATLAHYNRLRSVDGQWYVFIIDENDLVIAHPDAERRGLDVKGWVGTDANGYEFGTEMLAATEDGKWVSYVYRNPESGGIGTGDFELKNVWVKRRDGLLFASGWYIDADAFTKQLVSVAVDRFREGGIEATIAYFASPGSVLAGLESAIAYYNAAETVDGQWFAFIGDPDDKIVGHSDPSMVGQYTSDIFGTFTPTELTEITADGEWVDVGWLRVFLATYDGYMFGSGWTQGE